MPGNDIDAPSVSSQHTARNLRRVIYGMRGLFCLVRLLRSGRDAAGEPRGPPAGCARATSATRTSPLCPVMPELQVEIFQAQTMIMDSFRRYLTKTVHDHETAPCEGSS